MNRSFILLFVICFFLLVSALPCPADEFLIVPSIALRGEYDDNINGSYTLEEDDYILRVSPAIKISNKTERSLMDLSAKATRFLYSEYDEKDHTDQLYNGNFSYQVSEMTALKATAGYDITFRPDRDIDTTGLIVSDSKRDNQNYGMGIDFNLSEKSALSLGGAYSKEDWSGSTSTQDLESTNGYMSYTIDLGKWMEKTTGRFNAGYGQYKYETSDTGYAYTTFGMKYLLTERMNVTFDIGVNRADTDYLQPTLIFDPVLGFQETIITQNSKEYGGIGNVVFEINGELSRGSLKIGRDIKSSSGRGSTVERSELVLNYTRRLAERSALNVSSGLFQNRADRGNYNNTAIEEDTFFIRPNIRWELHKDLMLETGYDFAYTKDRIDNDTYDSNLFYLQISYGIKLME